MTKPEVPLPASGRGGGAAPRGGNSWDSTIARGRATLRGLGGRAVGAVEQFLEGDRLVGGPGGLLMLTILQDFREGVQEAPCRPLLELGMGWVSPLPDHIRQ